jgi:hypothetical protein
MLHLKIFDVPQELYTCFEEICRNWIIDVKPRDPVARCIHSSADRDGRKPDNPLSRLPIECRQMNLSQYAQLDRIICRLITDH